MNKVRRKAIEKIADRLIELEMEFETLYDEESDYLDNIPENLQSGERYEMVEDTVFQMEQIFMVMRSTYEDLMELC